MKFQKLPDFEIIYSFRYISIIVVIRLQWENFMRATHYLYSYLRVCIKCLHCKFHSKDNIIITDWIYFTWKKKQITLSALYRITWLKITLMSIEQITSWLLLFENCIQYWICVKKVQQKINKSYRNRCIKKPKMVIFIFLSALLQVLPAMFFHSANQKLFPEGFQVNSWIFQLSEIREVLRILWILQCIHRCFARLYVNIRELLSNSDFQFYMFHSLHKQLLDITRKILYSNCVVLSSLTCGFIRFLFCHATIPYNDNHYNGFYVFYIPIESK